jgi:hypothetical protein
MAERDEGYSIDELVENYGLTSYNRRLADKILNAFNQAMAVGRSDVGEQLEAALRVCVDEEQEMRNAAFLEKATSWRQFVDARDAYKSACGAHAEGSPEAEAALAAMRHAYGEWSRL